jgi:hypothetical protein
MPANMTRIMQEVPRALELSAKDYADEGPLGRKKLSRKQVAQRVEPIMGLIASGDIPLDEHSAKAIAAYVEEHHARSSKS